MSRTAQFIFANATGRNILIVLIPALLLTWVCMFTLPARFAELTGGMAFLDLQTGLTSETLFDQIRTYTPEAAAMYLWWSSLDFVWPFLAFTVHTLIIGWLLLRLSAADKPWMRVLLFVPYMTVLLDWLENVCLIALVLRLPEEPQWLAQTAIIVGEIKLVPMFLTQLITVVLVLAALYRNRFSGQASLA